MRRLSFLVWPFALTGCLIQQEAPQQQPVVDPYAVRGVVTLEELRLADMGGASIRAEFVHPSSMRSAAIFPVSVAALRKSRGALFASLEGPDTSRIPRGGLCEKKTASAAESSTAASAERISV